MATPCPDYENGEYAQSAFQFVIDNSRDIDPTPNSISLTDSMCQNFGRVPGAGSDVSTSRESEGSSSMDISNDSFLPQASPNGSSTGNISLGQDELSMRSNESLRHLMYKTDIDKLHASAQAAAKSIIQAQTMTPDNVSAIGNTSVGQRSVSMDMTQALSMDMTQVLYGVTDNREGQRAVSVNTPVGQAGQHNAPALSSSGPNDAVPPNQTGRASPQPNKSRTYSGLSKAGSDARSPSRSSRKSSNSSENDGQGVDGGRRRTSQTSQHSFKSAEFDASTRELLYCLSRQQILKKGRKFLAVNDLKLLKSQKDWLSVDNKRLEKALEEQKALVKEEKAAAKEALDKAEDRAKEVLDKVEARAKEEKAAAKEALDKAEARAKEVLDKTEVIMKEEKAAAKEALDKAEARAKEVLDKTEVIMKEEKAAAKEALDKAEARAKETLDKTEEIWKRALEKADKSMEKVELRAEKAEARAEKAESRAQELEQRLFATMEARAAAEAEARVLKERLSKYEGTGGMR
ncbi:hypothetical protein H0H92_014304 [Tricholoma furcatifolium]|nr:hypothetical protein H0H92_014304 [Tricholoma furcatifolium]